MWLKANINPEMTNICSVFIFETNLALEVSKMTTTAASARATTLMSSTSIRKGTTATVATCNHTSLDNHQFCRCLDASILECSLTMQNWSFEHLDCSV